MTCNMNDIPISQQTRFRMLLAIINLLWDLDTPLPSESDNDDAFANNSFPPCSVFSL